MTNSKPATYSVSEASSRGRIHADHDTPFRALFQRDRDRIVHSSAFRRLQYKTQVFINVVESDSYRNRLTHTLEVTQIARTIARALGLNEDLTEALALAHDLGHGPFGHPGESALDEMMHGCGGFDHNAQGLRIVDHLEIRYARFPGLNLTYESREGFVKNYVQDGKAGRSRELLGFAPKEMPSLEVQLVGHADEIAYDTHDLDDGLVSGALEEEQVRSVALWQRAEEQILAEHPAHATDQRLRQHAVVRRLISILVTDIIRETERRLKANRIASLKDVRNFPGELVGFSSEIEPQKRALERFLMRNFYNSPQLAERNHFWRERLKQVFSAYRADPLRLPEEYRKRIDTGGETVDRAICDYVAGMTDRFACKQFEELIGTEGTRHEA